MHFQKPMQLFKSFINSRFLKIRYKIALAIFISCVFFIMSFTVIAKYYFSLYQKRDIYSYMKQNNMQIVTGIDTYLTELKRSMLTMANNKYILSFLNGDSIDEVEYYRTYSYATELMMSIRYIRTDNVFNLVSIDGEKFLTSNPEETKLNFDSLVQQIKRIEDEKKISLFEFLMIPEYKSVLDGTPKTALLKSIFKGGRVTGYIIATIENSYFKNLLANIESNEGFSIIIDSKNNVFYSLDSEMQKENVQYKDLFERYKDKNVLFDMVINNKKYYAVSSRIDLLNLYIVKFADAKATEHYYVVMNLIILGFIFISILVSLFIANLVSIKITARLYVLRDMMKKVEEGNIAPRNLTVGKDEIGELYSSFNFMISKIDRLLLEITDYKILNKEAELYALQQQINPHFLYNVLEVISSIASYHNCNNICIICKKLAEMFRYNLSKSKSEFVSIKNEINHVENYISIQNFRFDGKFIIHNNVETNISEYKSLKFILQPIVENSIIHGFKEKKDMAVIDISAYESENSIEIIVSDNGIGIPPENLADINQSLNGVSISEKDLKHGIGLDNVNSRLKMRYGMKYGLTITSVQNVGTKVTIRIPLITNDHYIIGEGGYSNENSNS